MQTGVFRIDQDGDTLIITPTVDLRELDFDRIEQGAEVIFTILEQKKARNLVIDLHETHYYGSTALSFFVKLWKRVKVDGGKMVFCGVSESEREILQITHLDTLWPQCKTRDEALAEIRQNAASGT